MAYMQITRMQMNTDMQINLTVKIESNQSMIKKKLKHIFYLNIFNGSIFYINSILLWELMTS